MSTVQASQPAPAKDSGKGALVLLVIAVAAIVLWWMRPVGPPADAFVGLPLPPLRAAGWLNTPGPLADESLKGKVVLIDCFASWCGPCRAKMPKVVEFYNQFHERGVELIGLTPEAGDEAKDAEAYVKSVEGMVWPVGYGANMTLDMLGVEYLPTMILFDRSGRSVWGGDDLAQLEEAAIKALARK